MKCKPWISQRTLDLIERRSLARLDGDSASDKLLCKEIKASARKDRSNWLQGLADAGDWAALKRLRKGRQVQQTLLKNPVGDTVGTDARACTLADYLEQVQWRVRPASLATAPLPGIPSPIEVSTDAFTHVELRRAIKTLSSGNSIKDGDLPIEMYTHYFVATESYVVVSEVSL